MKTCSHCKIEFPATIEYFTKDCHNKDGFAYSCKNCQRVYNSRPERKERKKEWSYEYSRKPEVRERIRNHNNLPEVKRYINERKRLAYQKPEIKKHRAKYNKEYITRPGIKEKITEHKREWRNSPKTIKRMAELHQCYKEKALKVVVGGSDLICAKIKEWKCCNSDSLHYIKTLSIDHINGDGKKDRQKFNSRSYYKWITEHPEEAKKRLQVICMNAQFIKRHLNGENDAGRRNGRLLSHFINREKV